LVAYLPALGTVERERESVSEEIMFPLASKEKEGVGIEEI